MDRKGGSRPPLLRGNFYLACTKNPLDLALPPPATTSMNDIPAFTSGTVASIVVSFTNLYSILAGPAALKATP